MSADDVTPTEAEREDSRFDAIHSALSEAHLIDPDANSDALVEWIADRLAAVQAERDAWKSRTEQHDRRRMEVEDILDEILGTEEVDGAGEGLVADVRLAFDRLLAERDHAQASQAETWRYVCEIARAIGIDPDDVHPMDAVDRLTARAESAERRLAEVEALCDPANEGPRPYAVALDDRVLLAVDTDPIRAAIANPPAEVES